MSAADAAFAALRSSEHAPDLATRHRHLRDLRAGLVAAAEELAAAVDADFRGRPRAETMLSEIGLVLSHLDWTRRRLRRWLRPERPGLPMEFALSRARVERDALGVVGILGPWNYPVQLVLMPLVAALAGGNRVLLHPSEQTPRTAAALARMLGEALPADRVQAVCGDADEARRIAALPLDGIFYTGSTTTGRKVMEAAAKNLVPVVLELGGKSPALILPDADMEAAATSLMAGKLFSAGQTCVAPDYALVPRERLEELLAALRRATARLYPVPDGPDYAAMARDADIARIEAMLEGQDVVELMAPMPARPRMGARAVRAPDPDSALMREEIFGPVLPLVPYDGEAAACDFVNARPTPLALYVYGRDRAACARVTGGVRSGGAMINDCLLHVAAHTLPFGGRGASGMGAYHGREGFLALTRPRTVMVQSRLSPARLARPPYGKAVERLIRFVVR